MSNTNYHRTKCCYGLTMDLLDNIATELSFEFHLYVVRDQLFGSKQQRDIKDFLKASDTRTKRHTNNENSSNGGDGSSTLSQQTIADHDINDETQNSKYEDPNNRRNIYKFPLHRRALHTHTHPNYCSGMS